MLNNPSKPTRLTAHSGEADAGLFISGDKIFSIPYFQRSYSWKTKLVDRLNQDLLRLVDGESDVHFLGAIIFHGRRVNPADPVIFDIIDGQQRITTLYLYICSIVKYLCEQKRHDEAAGLCQNYLFINRPTGLLSNIKLYPSKGDRMQLNSVIHDILTDKTLTETLNLPSKFKFLPATGNPTGTVTTNYRFLHRFLKNQDTQGGYERVFSIYYNLLMSVTMVQIDVIDATNGPKIFSSLNSQQLPTTIGDLVRNEVFSKITDKDTTEAEIDLIDTNSWRPFYSKFVFEDKNYFDDYFFPYGLIDHPDLRKTDVYPTLQEDWRKYQNPIDIIEKLSIYQNAFLDLVLGSNLQGHSTSLARRFANLFRLGAPNATYPFIMRLSKEILCGEVKAEDGLEVLDLIESFLIRRAISGYDPTGLHAVFKRLWKACDGKPTRESIRDIIKGQRTVAWPEEDVFRTSILNRPLYSDDVTKYFILEYDRSLGGDSPLLNPEKEHVLPVHAENSWFSIFTREQHERMKDLLANLLPLSQEMNREVSNGPYTKKREIYMNDAAFKSTREFAKTYESWTPETISARSLVLADWAVKRWPY